MVVETRDRRINDGEIFRRDRPMKETHTIFSPCFLSFPFSLSPLLSFFLFSLVFGDVVRIGNTTTSSPTVAIYDQHYLASIDTWLHGFMASSNAQTKLDAHLFSDLRNCDICGSQHVMD